MERSKEVDISGSWWRLLPLAVMVACMLPRCLSLHLETCVEPLGMKSGKIKDEDINASSSYFAASVGPQNARLDLDLNGGAWCPKRAISKDVIEYLEISLNSVHVITAVATQGRFGNGQGLEFSEEYMIEYWRPGLSAWYRFRNRIGQQVLEGNTNTYSVVKKDLDPIIIASKVRFIPFSVHQRTVCMRVELYGCPWTEGLLSYSLPQGERRGVNVDLSDKTYDGIKDDSTLHGGLGQLADGQTGDDNFRLESAGMGKGYEWVGWKNETGHSRPIQITFEFDTVRNFSSVLFYCNNMFTREVQVFSSAKVWLSVGGKYYYDPPINFSYMPDLFIQKARNVTIYLHHRTGRFVKVELQFESKWILISEVYFISVPATGNFSEEDPPTVAPIVSTAMHDGALANEYVGLVIGVLAAVILLLAVVIFVIAIRNKRRKLTTPHMILKPVDSRVTVNMKDLGLTYSQCSPLSYQQNGSVYGQSVILKDPDPDKLVYQEPRDCKVGYQGKYGVSGTTASREYAVPDVAQTSSSSASPLHFSSLSSAKPSFPQTLPKPLKRPPSERFYAATDVVNLSNVQSGNSLYSVPKDDLNIQKDPSSREARKHSLNALETTGENQFGMLSAQESETYSKGSERTELNQSQLHRGQNTYYQDYGLRPEPRPVLGKTLQCRRAGHQAHQMDSVSRHAAGSLYDHK